MMKRVMSIQNKVYDVSTSELRELAIAEFLNSRIDNDIHVCENDLKHSTKRLTLLLEAKELLPPKLFKALGLNDDLKWAKFALAEAKQYLKKLLKAKGGNTDVREELFKRWSESMWESDVL